MNDLAAATQADAVGLLLRCLTTASSNPKGDPSTVSKSLQVLKCLLAVDSSKVAFARADGASQLADLLSQQSRKQGAPCMTVLHSRLCHRTIISFAGLICCDFNMFCKDLNSDSRQVCDFTVTSVSCQKIMPIACAAEQSCAASQPYIHVLAILCLSYFALYALHRQLSDCDCQVQIILV